MQISVNNIKHKMDLIKESSYSEDLKSLLINLLLQEYVIETIKEVQYNGWFYSKCNKKYIK